MQAVKNKGVSRDDQVWMKLCCKEVGWNEECTDPAGGLSLQSSGSWRPAPSSDDRDSVVIVVDERQVEFRELRTSFALSCTEKLCECNK
jgi:hypothetical protein